MARLQLAPKNHVTLDEIQRAVTQCGFTPRQARVSMAGRLRVKHGAFVLQVSRTPYRLVPAAAAKNKWEALRRLSPGTRLRIQGQAGGKSAKPNSVTVKSFVVLPVAAPAK